MKNVLNWFILTLLLFVVFSTGALSLNQYANGNVCPSIIGIPTCYIIFLLTLIALFAHMGYFRLGTTAYWISIGLITALALTGTIGEYAGFAVCPKVSNGIPMCYYALGIAAVLLVLKYSERRLIDPSIP